MLCDHTRRIRERSDPQYDDYDDGESSRYEYDTVSTMEDIDTGRMRCTLCGKVDYYTQAWRDFWETGKPCLGSDKFDREKG